MVFRAVVLTSVTWIWVFVSQRCGEDGVSGSCADLCDMDCVFCVTGGGGGVLRMVFRAVALTSVTWNEGFVSQGCGEDGVSGSCAGLCDMDCVFCVTGVW